MVSLRHRSIFYRIIWSIGHSPGRIFEVLAGLGLLGLLLQTLIGYGGFLPFGASMVGVSKTLILVAGLHALAMLFRDHRPGIEWELLLPLPYIVYAWAHWQFLSPAKVEAGMQLAVTVQAYALYFIVFNTVNGVRTGKWILTCLKLSVLCALFTAFFQYYLFPDWMVGVGRMRNPAYASGAAGFLQDPQNLGAILITLPSLGVLMAVKYFRSGPTWVWQSALSFAMIIGLLLCSTPAGLIAMSLTLLVLPLFMTNITRDRIKIYRRFIFVLMPLIAFIWFGTEALNQRLADYISGPGDVLGALSREVGMSQFLANPLLGQGLGSYAANWETHVPLSSPVASTYAVSAYIDILAETGLVGFALILLPVIFLMFKAFRLWLSTPYLKINEEAMGRIEKLPPGHPMRRRLQKDKGRVPTQKAVIGGLLLGLAGFLAYAGWDYALKLPFVLFLAACLAGALVGYMRWNARPREKRGRWVIVAVLPLLLATWAASFGLPRFYASHLCFIGEEQLAYLQEDPDHIFQDPSSAYHTADIFQMALELAPESSSAWLGLGVSQLLFLDARLQERELIATTALPALEKAFALDPESWLANYSLARAQLIIGVSGDVILEHLRKAPRSP
jgi:hypothetical protein